MHRSLARRYLKAELVPRSPSPRDEFDAPPRTAFYDATDAIEELGLPFGFDPRVWIQVQDLTDRIADAMDAEADELGIGDNARTLRQILVNYV